MSEKKVAETSEFFNYKGFPLVRNGNTIYYGNMFDEYVVKILILEKQKLGEIEVANKVRVFRMLTDENLPADKRIDKTVDKDGLYEALDIANIWLSRLVS